MRHNININLLGKTCCFIIVFLSIIVIAYAQQLPQHTQYMFNKIAINPGAAGAEKYSEITLSHRSQWTGFEGAPSTQFLTIHGPVKDKKFGLGGYIFNDITGPIRNTGLSFIYAYHLQVSDNSALSLGLLGSLLQSAINGPAIRLYHSDDKLIDQTVRYNTIVPDAAFGALFFTDKYFVGLSILHLAKTRVNILLFENADYRAGLPLSRHFYLTGGYNFEVGEKYQLQPSLLLNYMSNNPMQITATMMSFYEKFIHFGISWSSGDAVSLIAGANIIEGLRLSYSYDIGISTLRSHNSGSHEIVLSYRFNDKNDVKPRAMFSR